jgi:putative membrane protein
MKIVFKILFTALGVLLASAIISGIHVDGFWTAVLVAIILGVLNVTIGALLKLLTLPLSIVTFGFFFLVINALMFWAASFIKGFHVAGFWAAFFGSLIVTIISMLGRRLVRGSGQNYHSQI